MDKFIQKIFDNRFSDLKVLSVDAFIPVSESLLNEMIRAALEGNSNVESCQVTIHEENKVAVKLKTSLWPWPLNLKLKLDKTVDLASFSSPKIRAWLENNHLLGRLGSILNVMPEGIKLYGDQVVVDLGVFLRQPDQKGLLGLIEYVGMNTDEGKLILDVKIGVD
jgi:hypothetical protein